MSLTTNANSEFDPFGALPVVLNLKILEYTAGGPKGVRDLCIAGRTCQNWRRLTNDNSLWQTVANYWNIPIPLSVQDKKPFVLEGMSIKNSFCGFIDSTDALMQR